MNINEKILATAYDVLRGRRFVERRAWHCLKAVRQVIEQAMSWPDGELYRRYLKHFVDGRGPGDPWARDLEFSFKKLNWHLPFSERLPGDILFSDSVSRPWGHMGILLDGGMVFENTSANRGGNFGEAIRLTPLERWDSISTVGRFMRHEQVPREKAVDNKTVRLFDQNNRLIGSGTLVAGTDKVYPFGVNVVLKEE